MAKRPAKKSAGFTGDERIALFYGTESFLQADYTRKLRDAIAKKTGGDVETLRFDGTSATLADVFDELRSYGLMQQHKIVVVTDADKFVKDRRPALERYADAPESMSTLVLRAETWHSGNLDKKIAKSGVVIKCEPLDRAAAKAWVMNEAKDRYRVKLEPEAAQALVDHIQSNLGRLESELGKLAAGVPEGGAITAEQVHALVGHTSDEKAWDIQDAMLTGKADLALIKLHELHHTAGLKVELLTWAMADLVRKQHYAMELLDSGMGDWQVCTEVKIFPPHRQKPVLDGARRLGRRQLAHLLDTIVEMDRRAKSGFAEAMTNLERFCVQYTAGLR